jgi:hypothetical protein
MLQDGQELGVQIYPWSQIEVVIEQSGDHTNPSLVPRWRYRLYGEYGHNVQTCQKGEEILEDSDSK